MSPRIAPPLACILGILLVSPSLAGVRTLTWDPSVGATGYKLYYGDASRDYAFVVDVTDDMVVTGNGSLQYTTGDLYDCTQWYFAVTAYNVAGESGFSNEVSWLAPMTLDGASTDVPGQPVMQGTQFSMSLTGAGFATGATITVDHPTWTCADYADPADCQAFLDELRHTVRLENPTITCNTIEALATIEPITPGAMPALVGDAADEYTVTITNPDGTSTTTQLFSLLPSAGEPVQVEADPARFDIARSVPASDGRLDGYDVTWFARLLGMCRWPGTAELPCCNPNQDLAACEAYHADYSPEYDLDGDGWIGGGDLALWAPQAPTDPDLLGTCWDGASWKAEACQ